MSPNNYSHSKEAINSWFTEGNTFGFHASKLNLSGYLKEGPVCQEHLYLWDYKEG